MIAANAFDFSGKYVFIAPSCYMHRLDESIRPLLEERGGRISRIYSMDVTPNAATGDFSLETLPADFFEKENVRAVFALDAMAPSFLVPQEVPLIAFTHAFWCPVPHSESVLQGCLFYLGNADFYLTQDGAATHTHTHTRFPASPPSGGGMCFISCLLGISNLTISAGAGLRNHTRPRFCTPAATTRMAFRSSWKNAKPSSMRA